MLFRPVSGPELEVVYDLIAQSDVPVSRQTIYRACLLHHKDKSIVSPQSIDDALSFLVAAFLVEDRDGFCLREPRNPTTSFQLAVINRLQALTNRKITPKYELDSLYLLLLQELFIKPDLLYVSDVHTEANKLRPVAELGGLSQEKIRSWKRVMAYLGIGRRIREGFQCVYSPTLLQEILATWDRREGFIQDFLEEHLVGYLPHQTQTGDLAHAVGQPLQYLHQQQDILMRPYQDAPNKPYFGEQRLRYLFYHGGVA